MHLLFALVAAVTLSCGPRQQPSAKYQLTPLAPDVTRTVREHTWTDEGHGGHLAVWALDQVAVEESGGILPVPHLAVLIGRASFDASRLIRPALELAQQSLPDGMQWAAAMQKIEYYDDGKGKTKGTGGARRFYCYPPLLAWLARQVPVEVAYLCAQSWSAEQLLRPYGHHWEFDRDQIAGWPEGQVQTWIDGEKRTVDDGQHLECEPAFAAAALGDPLGLLVLANQLSYQVNAYLGTPRGPALAEREDCWLVDLAIKCAVLRLGENDDGTPNEWADAFCRGLTARAFLERLVDDIVGMAGDSPYRAQPKNYKFEKLLEEWPLVTLLMPQPAGLPARTTTTQPREMGEYPWQQGMRLFALRRAFDFLEAAGDHDRAAAIESLCKWLAQRTADRFWFDGERWTVPGCTTFYELSESDAVLLEDAFEFEHGERNGEPYYSDPHYLRPVELPSGNWTFIRVPQAGATHQQAFLGAMGVLAWCPDDLRARSVVQEAIDARWDRDADLLAPAVVLMQETPQ